MMWKYQNRRIVFCVGVLALVAAACAPPAADESDEIRARSAAWVEAFNARDRDALVALYTDDARVLAANAPMEQGAEAVGATFQAMFDAGLTGTLESVEVMAVGEMGHHLGTYTLGVEGEVADRGKFIELWRKVDGEWRISADMFSSDLPAASGMPDDLLLATHEVEDAEHWLAAWRGENSRHQLFAEHGAPFVKTFRSQEHPNLTGLLIGVTDLEAFQAMLASPEGEAAKKADGVKEATVRILAEAE